MKYVNIRISEASALKLKILAKEKNTTIIALLDQILNNPKLSVSELSEFDYMKKEINEIQIKTAKILEILQQFQEL